MRKKILVLLTAVVCIIFSCGKKQKVSDKIIVTVWAHEGQPAEKKALEDIFAKFNQHHKEVQVKVEFKQEQGYNSRVSAAAIAGELPDILDVDGPYTAQHAENGILAPVEIPDSIRADFLPTILSQGTYQNRLYTLGAFESTVALFYNRDMLNDCGIHPPSTVEEAWTWETFLKVLRKIKKEKPDIIPLETFMVWEGEWLTYAFSPLIWANNGRVLSKDGNHTAGSLNGDASVQAMAAFQKLFVEKLTDKNAPAGQFRRKKAAMAWGVFNRWPLYREAGINFGMTPLPRFKKSASPSGSWCWGMTSACRNKEAALRVLLWIVHPEHGIAPICRANSGIPARISAFKNFPVYEKEKGLFAEQLKKTARSRPVTPHYAALSKEVSRAVADIAKGSDVKSVFNRAAERIDAVLLPRRH